MLTLVDGLIGPAATGGAFAAIIAALRITERIIDRRNGNSAKFIEMSHNVKELRSETKEQTQVLREVRDAVRRQAALMRTGD